VQRLPTSGVPGSLAGGGIWRAGRRLREGCIWRAATYGLASERASGRLWECLSGGGVWHAGQQACLGLRVTAWAMWAGQKKASMGKKACFGWLG
jgi:hypothetical protein